MDKERTAKNEEQEDLEVDEGTNDASTQNENSEAENGGYFRSSSRMGMVTYVIDSSTEEDDEEEEEKPKKKGLASGGAARGRGGEPPAKKSKKEEEDDDSESGSFVVLKSDIDIGKEDYPSWKIDGLLQKSDRFRHEDKFKGTNMNSEAENGGYFRSSSRMGMVTYVIDSSTEEDDEEEEEKPKKKGLASGGATRGRGGEPPAKKSKKEEEDDDSESGSFVVLKSDIDIGKEDYPSWKIDGLLQKSDRFRHEDKFKGTNMNSEAENGGYFRSSSRMGMVTYVIDSSTEEDDEEAEREEEKPKKKGLASGGATRGRGGEPPAKKSKKEEEDDDSESGSFVVLKSDIDIGKEDYPLWKIHGLLQKFDQFRHEDKTVFKGTNMYVGCSKTFVDRCYPIKVGYERIDGVDSAVTFDPTQIKKKEASDDIGEGKNDTENSAAADEDVKAVENNAEE